MRMEFGKREVGKGDRDAGNVGERRGFPRWVIRTAGVAREICVGGAGRPARQAGRLPYPLTAQGRVLGFPFGAPRKVDRTTRAAGVAWRHMRNEFGREPRQLRSAAAFRLRLRG
jgi:hypothetical protein